MITQGDPPDNALRTHSRFARILEAVIICHVICSASSAITVSMKCPAHCRCDSIKRSVDCAEQKLKSIPAGIPSDTLTLDLQDNRITSVNVSDLSGLHQLRVLNLAYNRIRTLSGKAFVDLHRLQVFNFSGNLYPPDRLASDIVCALNGSDIRVLQLDNVDVTYHTLLVECMAELPLEELYLGRNPLGKLPDFAFSRLSNLQKLSLYATVRANAADFNPMAFANLTMLKELNLRYNKMTSFPRFAFADGSPIVPNLTKLYVNRNYIPNITLVDTAVLLNLQDLDVGYNRLNRLENNVFGSLPSLVSLSVQTNYIEYIGQFALNSSTLRTLYFRNIKYRFGMQDKWLFSYCPNLTELILKQTKMSYFIRLVMLHNLPKIEELNLESTGIQALPIGFFRNFPRLKKLVLTDNHIATLSRTLLEELTRLEYLYLDNNRFTVFNESTFPPQLRSQLRIVSFLVNPFACTCPLLWFTEWIKDTNATVQGNKNQYQCYSPPELKGRTLWEFPLKEEDCWIEPLYVVVIVSVACCSVVVMVIGALFYRFRWHLGYLYFSLKARIRQYREIQDNKEYLYDAFLAYNGQDLPWIRQHVLPALEEEAGLQLCLHDRNWLPGLDIMDNIVTSIENSRKTVLVVSNAFASSQWCQLELTMAQHRLFEEDRNNMVLILLEDIDPDNMTPRLALQMRSRTYIQWTEDPVGQALFWKKLVRTMMKPDKPFSRTTLVAN